MPANPITVDRAEAAPTSPPRTGRPTAVSDFRFRSAAESFDVARTVPISGAAAGLADRTMVALATLAADHRAVGALPFELTAAPAIGVGKVETPAGAGVPSRTMPDPRPSGVVRRFVEHPLPPDYCRMVEAALRRIEGSATLQKVVLARSVAVEFDGAVDPEPIFQALVAANPSAWSFAAELVTGTSRGRWVGASPELLLSRRGRTIRSFPLAGSVGRRSNALADARARHALTMSGKDRREHALVVEAIADILAPHCRRMTVPAAPTPVAAGNLWHLGTPIAGELRDESLSSLHLAQLLHPTPALGGWPRAAAQRIIGELEGRDRGFYGGAIGWCDSTGDGTWVVTIRCGEISGSTVRAHAGAGIVLGSDPEVELAETTVKLGTLLAGLGLSKAVVG